MSSQPLIEPQDDRLLPSQTVLITNVIAGIVAVGQVEIVLAPLDGLECYVSSALEAERDRVGLLLSGLLLRVLIFVGGGFRVEVLLPANYKITHIKQIERIEISKKTPTQAQVPRTGRPPLNGELNISATSNTSLSSKLPTCA